MDALHTALLVLHFLGLAAIFGGAVESWRTARATTSPVTLWGARAQVVTGLALAALIFTGDDADDANHIKITVKLVIALVIAGIAEANARKAVMKQAALVIAILAAINVIVAVAW